jgi:hypothetical protein
MEKTNKILTLGDIHGRSVWKKILFGGDNEFFMWKLAATEGYLEHEGPFEFQSYDKIIFVGDYCDSYNKSNTEILENLEDIVLFAKTYPDLVVLLLGNHDVHYIVSNECCSGYRSEMRPDLNRIFTENADLFKFAYLDEFTHEVNGRTITNKTIWTHAGITQGWWKEFMRDINSPRYRFNEFFIGSEHWSIDKVINLAWKLKVDNLYNVDSHSGGMDLWAGPIWVRPTILKEFHLEGYDQVIGHTPHSSVMKFCPLFGVESNPEKLNTLTFVDALEHEDYHVLNRNI